MFAVEFKANINNGLIEIPDEYKQEFEDGNSVKVIILKKQKNSATGIIARLTSNPVKVKGFTPLTREEAHERK